jgi:hypothetical protein
VDGPRAVFRYVTPAERSHYEVGGCCLPDSDRTTAFQRLAGLKGEIAIDPASGAILRLALQADLKSTTPLARSDIMIEYGQVVGGSHSSTVIKFYVVRRHRPQKDGSHRIRSTQTGSGLKCTSVPDFRRNSCSTTANALLAYPNASHRHLMSEYATHPPRRTLFLLTFYT